MQKTLRNLHRSHQNRLLQQIQNPKGRHTPQPSHSTPAAVDLRRPVGNIAWNKEFAEKFEWYDGWGDCYGEDGEGKDELDD